MPSIAALVFCAFILIHIALARRSLSSLPDDERRAQEGLQRSFNEHASSGALDGLSYDAFKREMRKRGVGGEFFDVGHLQPDPSKKTKRDREDRGWNLFAQEWKENKKLGHKAVPCSDASRVGRTNVDYCRV
jgi:hypothetical protein